MPRATLFPDCKKPKPMKDEGFLAPVVGNQPPPCQGHADRYPCILCSHHFNSQHAQAEHLRVAHNVEDPYICHECPEAFQDWRDFKQHCDQHSRSRFSKILSNCLVLTCSYRSSSSEALQRHHKHDQMEDTSHQPECSQCSYLNESLAAVSIHMLHRHSQEAITRRRTQSQMNGAIARRNAMTRDQRSTEEIFGAPSAANIPSFDFDEQAGEHASPSQVGPEFAASDAFLKMQNDELQLLSVTEQQHLSSNTRRRKNALRSEERRAAREAAKPARRTS